MTRYRVLFHLDEGGRMRAEMVLRNIGNLLAELDSTNVEVELLANGEGLLALLKTPNLHGETVDLLAAQGVRFAACGVAAKGFGLTKDALLGPVDLVPSGIGELVRKQAEGWAYIRP